jgi:hypothetical protein
VKVTATVTGSASIVALLLTPIGSNLVCSGLKTLGPWVPALYVRRRWIAMLDEYPRPNHLQSICPKIELRFVITSTLNDLPASMVRSFLFLFLRLFGWSTEMTFERIVAFLSHFRAMADALKKPSWFFVASNHLHFDTSQLVLSHYHSLQSQHLLALIRHRLLFFLVRHFNPLSLQLSLVALIALFLSLSLSLSSLPSSS